jgi:hypothetical protein
MGIRIVLAAINDGANLDTVEEHGGEAIELGKIGSDFVAILTAISDEIGGQALLAQKVGRAVGRDLGDGWPRTRYIAPDSVRAIAQSLEVGLAGDPIPRPDDDGYVADERMESNERVVRAAAAIEAAGLDPMSPRDTDELRKLFSDVRDHYRRAAQRGDGMLVCFR